MLTWSAVNVSSTQETVPLPDAITNGQSALLIFKPVTLDDISFRLRCVASIPGNANVVEGGKSTTVNISGKKKFLACNQQS